MINPILRISIELVPGHMADESVELIGGNLFELGKQLGYMVGYAEGIMSHVPDRVIPIVVDNFDKLDDEGRFLAKDALTKLRNHYNGKVSSGLTDLRLMVKLEAEHNPPRVLIYAIGEVK
jgi:hypothetical protein